MMTRPNRSSEGSERPPVRTTQVVEVDATVSHDGRVRGILVVGSTTYEPPIPLVAAESGVFAALSGSGL